MDQSTADDWEELVDATLTLNLQSQTSFSLPQLPSAEPRESKKGPNIKSKSQPKAALRTEYDHILVASNFSAQECSTVTRLLDAALPGQILENRRLSASVLVIALKTDELAANCLKMDWPFVVEPILQTQHASHVDLGSFPAAVRLARDTQAASRMIRHTLATQLNNKNEKTGQTKPKPNFYQP
eukprot:c12705_g1_i3.p1 GENE.c12705_g1_i3~~c12705_g1_i3.p1  ORF type:complete len:197 (-),score=44.64 c12705_g1_i3:14-565(-)